MTGSGGGDRRDAALDGPSDTGRGPPGQCAFHRRLDRHPPPPGSRPEVTWPIPLRGRHPPAIATALARAPSVHAWPDPGHRPVSSRCRRPDYLLSDSGIDYHAEAMSPSQRVLSGTPGPRYRAPRPRP